MKFGVARFDYDGQFSGGLDREASDEWASRFLFICVLDFLYNFDAGASSYIILITVMMETKFIKKTNYQAPLLEVIEVEVEHGFAGSTGGTGEDMGWG